MITQIEFSQDFVELQITWTGALAKVNIEVTNENGSGMLSLKNTGGNNSRSKYWWLCAIQLLAITLPDPAFPNPVVFSQ